VKLREFSSIPVRLPGSGPYRISAAAKPEIRHQLENRFGYRFASIYADIEGLAQYLEDSPEKLIKD